MVVKVEWTRSALREFTIWIAGFIRDEIDLRVSRKFHLSAVELELKRTDGHPLGSQRVAGRHGEIVVWEYASSAMWLLIRRELRPATFFQRLLGREDTDLFIVTAIRRPPTPQELQSLRG